MAERLLNGNDISFHLSKQTVKGAIDANPVFDEFRRTEGKARKATSYVQSTEVKTNRQARSNIKDATTFDAELSFEMTEQTVGFFQDAIQGVEAIATVTGITIAATATGFTDSGTGFTQSVGDYIFVSGMAAAGLNRTYRVTVATTGELTTSPAPSVTESAGATATVQTRKTVSGSSIAYYTGQTRTVDETKAADTDYFTPYDGQIDTASFEVGETGIVAGSMAIRFEQLTSGTAAISGQTNSTKDSSEVLNAINDVVRMWVNGLDSDPVCTVKSMGFDFSNNLQSDTAAGCEGSEFGNGDITLSGSLNARNRIDDSLIWRDRYNDGTNVALAIEIDHGAGKHTIIEVPQAIITDHSMPDGSNVVANSEMTYTAEEDSRGVTCVIYKDWQNVRAIRGGR